MSRAPWSTAAFMSVSYPIETGTILTQDCCLCLWGKLLHIVDNDVHDCCVIARKRANRPVGTDHQAAGSKRLDDHIHITLKVARLPLLPSCFRDHARELTEYVGKLRQAAQILLPGGNLPIGDPRLGDVIEDKRLL